MGEGGGALIAAKGYAVNIEWYKQKGKTNSLDYVIEDHDSSIPSN